MKHNKLEMVMQAVCMGLEMQKKDILEKTRQRDVVMARHTFHFLCYEMRLGTYSAIGKYTGKDHATVRNSYEKIKEWQVHDPNLRKDLTRIKNLIFEDARVLMLHDLLCKIPHGQMTRFIDYVDKFEIEPQINSMKVVYEAV